MSFSEIMFPEPDVFYLQLTPLSDASSGCWHFILCPCSGLPFSRWFSWVDSHST